MQSISRPTTRPEGVSANDGAGQPERRQPVPAFKGGGAVNGSEYTRSVHASSEGPVKLPVAPAGARLTFASESGQQILGRNAQLHDRVIVPGPWGESSLGSALHAGVIVELPGGGFGLPDAAGGPAVGTERTTESETAEAAADRSGEPQAAQQDLLPEAHETFYQQVSEAAGDLPVVNSMVDALVSGEPLDVDSAIIGRLAERRGASPENALQAIAHVEGQFRAQAQRAMESMVGDTTELYAWMRGTDAGKEAMRQAALTQVHDRSLSGWRDAAKTWILETARTNPTQLANADFGPDITTRVERGQLLIDHPSFGTTTFESAVRSGLIRIG
jgi:hypothetical protein